MVAAPALISANSAWFPTPRPVRSRRWSIAFGYLGCGIAATALLLLEPAGRPPFDSIWAEDGKVFLTQALGPHWYSSIFSSYEGYLHIVPRLFGIAARLIPLSDAAILFTVGSAAIRAGVALFVFRAAAGYVRAPWPRVALAAFVLLVRSGETLDNVANVHWYLLYAAIWAVLWRPDSRWENGLAALIVVLAIGSDPLALLIAPVVLMRCLILRRIRDHAVTVACIGAAAVQLAVMAGASRVEARPPSWPEIVRAFDARVLLGLVATMRGASALADGPARLAALILAVVLLAAAVLPGLRAGWPIRLTVLYLLAASAVVFVLGWRHTLGYVEFPSRSLGGNSRYTVVPMLLVVAAVLVSLSAVRRAVLVSGVAAAVLVVAVVGIVLHTNGSPGPTWRHRLDAARVACRSGGTEVLVPVDPGPPFAVRVPCARLTRAARR